MTNKTPRVRKFSHQKLREDGTFPPELRGLWPAKVLRGRKCSNCRRFIPPGEQSLRFIDQKGWEVKCAKGMVKIKIERAICKECSVSKLTEIVAELNKPRDDEMFYKSCKRKGMLPPETEW
jgi:hypothetical protein